MARECYRRQMDAQRSKTPTRHPGIYRRDTAAGAVRYYAQFRDGDGKLRSKTFLTLAEALKWRALELGDKERGAGLRSGGSMTFEAYSEHYLDSHPQWRDSTRQATIDRLRSLNAALGRKRLERITTQDVQNYVNERKAAGKSASTIAAERNLVASVLKMAVNERILGYNPAQGVKAPTVRKDAESRNQRLTADQVRRLLEAMPERWHTFASLIAQTGLRGGEAAGLTVDRVNLLKRELVIDRQLVKTSNKRPVFGPVKTPSSVRTIPMTDEVAQLLEDHISEGVGIDGLLFSTRTGRGAVRSVRGDVWREAVREAGLEDELPEAVDGWHALRHTFGSNLIENGVDPLTVSKLLGHNGAEEVIRTYAHSSDDKLASAMTIASSLVTA